MTLLRTFLSFFVFSFVCSDALSTEKRAHGEDDEVLTQLQGQESSAFFSEDTFAAKKEESAKRPKLESASKGSPKKVQSVKKASPRVSKKEPPPPNRSIPRAISAPKQIKADAFYGRYCDIIKKGPFPIQPIISITPQDEDREGSRKWVKTYKDSLSHTWHKESSNIIREMRRVNDGESFVPGDTNFAMARLTYVLTEGMEPVVTTIPFFFISGWPANNHKNTISAFSKRLSEGKVSPALEPYKTYGLRFVGLAYQGGVELSVRNGG